MSTDARDESRHHRLIAFGRSLVSRRTRGNDLEGVEQVLSATTSIAKAMATVTELDQVLQVIVERGRELVGARTMFVSLPRGDALEIAAAAGDQSLGLPGTRVPLEGSTGGEVLRDGRSLRAKAEQLSVSPEELGLTNVSDCLFVPLTFRERRLGVLVAMDHARSSGGFDRDDEELLLLFASSAANAVATAQNVSEFRLREAVDSAEQERRRWARELHDETLQGLAGLQVRLSIAEQQSPDPPTSARVRDVLDDLGTEIRKLRTLITELRPAALDELGLEPALESLVDAIGASSDLEIDLQVDVGGGRLDPELETTAYRLMQEALTNVVKHADADRCVVELLRDDGALLLVVRDDGRGLDPSALDRRGGFGVTGMRERARLAGGDLSLGAGRSGGTVLRARLPITPPAAPDRRRLDR